MQKEIFKDIPGYEGLYQVSDLGRVKGLQRHVPFKSGTTTVKGRILLQYKDHKGYLEVVLRKNGKFKRFPVHQLVTMAFQNHIPCGMKLVVNHKNMIKTDNRNDNLEIVTNRENCNRKHIAHSSKFTGVNWSKQNRKWVSFIFINGKSIHLGSFSDELKASEAYENAVKNLHND